VAQQRVERVEFGEIRELMLQNDRKRLHLMVFHLLGRGDKNDGLGEDIYTLRGNLSFLTVHI